MSWCSFLIYIVLQIFFLYFYVCMRRTLKKYTSKKMKETMDALNNVFCVEIGGLTFSLILSACMWFELISFILCQYSVRMVLF